jgi:hypothetical protein
MQEGLNNEIISETKQVQRNRFSVRKLAKRLLLCFTILILLLATFCFLLSISTPFRQFTLRQALNLSHQFLTADVQIKDIRFNRLQGISIDGIRVITAGDTLADIEQMVVDVDFESLLSDNIVINYVEMINPRVKLMRSAVDSIWNFNKIAPPSDAPDDDTTAAKTVIKVKSLKMTNGYFVYWDSTTTWHPASDISWIQMKWDNLNLTLHNTVIDFGEPSYSTEIANISAMEICSGMQIDRLSMNAGISPAGIYAEKANINANGSNIVFDASMRQFNVFGEPEERKIDNAVMSIDIDVKEFNPIFIKNFAHIPIELGYVKHLQMQASGTLQDMRVPSIKVDTYNSHIELENVRTTHLTTPELLSYSGTITSSHIRRSDFANILQNLDLSAVPDFIHTYIMNTDFFGTLDSVWSRFDVRSGIGNVKGIADIVFMAEPMRYHIDVDAKSVNLAKVVGNSSMHTDINGHIKISGKDVSPDKMNAEVVVKLEPSHIMDYSFADADIALSYKGNDTIAIERFYADLVDAHKSIGSITLSGGISPKNTISTNVIANLTNVNLLSLLNDSLMPSNVTATVKLKSTGLNLDSTNTIIELNVDEIDFDTKSMFPFTMYLMLNTSDSVNKNFAVYAKNDLSQMFRMSATGDISVDNIVNGIANSGIELASIIQQRINNIIDRENDTIVTIEPPKRRLEKCDINIVFVAKSLNFLDLFIDSLTIGQTDIHTKMRYSVADSICNFYIDTAALNAINLNYKGNDISVKNLFFNGLAELNCADTTSIISALRVNINARSPILFGDIKIDSLLLQTDYQSDKFTIALQSSYNATVSATMQGGFYIDDDDVNITLDSLNITYIGNKWHNTEPITATANGSEIAVKALNMLRIDDEIIKENIHISGTMKGDTLDSISVVIQNFQLSDINPLLMKPIGVAPLPLSAKLDSLALLLNGTLTKPIVTSTIQLTDLNYDKLQIGNFNANINYADERITGNANISDNNNRLFNMQINSIPLYIGIDTNIERIPSDKKLDVAVTMDNLPLKIFTPFAPSVDALTGKINGTLNIGGYLPDRYEYSGNISFENIGFRVIPTNMFYNTNGSVSIITDLISFENLSVRNKAEDLKKGEAIVSGSISLNNFEVGSLDITARTKQFQVLSDKSKLSMPGLYGKMVIATGSQPIHFYGTLAEPNLTGDISVLNAEITMPNVLEEGSTRVEKKFTYINKDKIRIEINSSTDSNKWKEDKKKEQLGNKSFVDLLDININLRIGEFSLTLDLGNNLGQIFARIGTHANAPLNYVKERTQEEAKLYGGEIELLDKSTVQIFKTMSAKGTISFPTARISQPKLNLTAEYTDHLSTPTRVNYSVFVYITGTAQNPQMDLSYSVNGNIVTGDKSQVQSDALNALTRGVLRGYNDDNSNGILGEGSNLTTMFASQLASKTLTDLLLRTGIIQSANLKFDDDNFTSANVRISGSLAGVATWTIGGKIDDLASNYNISIDIPININNDALNLLLLQISKYTDVYNSTFDRNAKDWEVKLKLNGNW